MFRWCLVRYLNLVNKNPAKIGNVDSEFAKQLSFNETEFFVHKKHYVKIEKQNNISITKFGYKDKKPYHIYASKQNFEKHVDLLLLSNSEYSHYVIIKDLDRFMTNKAKHHVKKHFCQYCLQCFSSKKLSSN